jgi:hypothetical protein
MLALTSFIKGVSTARDVAATETPGTPIPTPAEIEDGS